MLLFPYAKINLGLNVLRRRVDGYHDLQSVMLPIPLCDALEVVVDPEVEDGKVLYTRSGLYIPGDSTSDLCMRAVAAVGALHPLPGIRVHLHKVIPMGAGLGGGSSDGTHMLISLNELLSLGLNYGQLHRMASELGSDCPFFLLKKAQLAEGRGEILRELELDLAGLWLVVVNPGEHISTPEAFRNCNPSGQMIDPQQIVREKALEEWDRMMPNTLEPYVMANYVAVASVKRKLMDAGAAYSAMSGSGSTVFGFFQEEPAAMQWPDDHVQWIFKF